MFVPGSLDKRESAKLWEEAFIVQCTIPDARALIKSIAGDEYDCLSNFLDQAQGEVATGNAECGYLVFKIIPG